MDVPDTAEIIWPSCRRWPATVQLRMLCRSGSRTVA